MPDETFSMCFYNITVNAVFVYSHLNAWLTLMRVTDANINSVGHKSVLRVLSRVKTREEVLHPQQKYNINDFKIRVSTFARQRAL